MKTQSPEQPANTVDDTLMPELLRSASSTDPVEKECAESFLRVELKRLRAEFIASDERLLMFLAGLLSDALLFTTPDRQISMEPIINGIEFLVRRQVSSSELGDIRHSLVMNGYSVSRPARKE